MIRSTDTISRWNWLRVGTTTSERTAMATRSGLRDGDATRRLLVDAASKLFASNGVEGVSIRAVNAEAGVGPASVHYHFGSKDALLDAVLLQEGAGVIARVTELASDLEVCPR